MEDLAHCLKNYMIFFTESLPVIIIIIIIIIITRGWGVLKKRRVIITSFLVFV